MNPAAQNTANLSSPGTDFTIWLVMFAVLIIVALILAYMSKDMER